MTTDSTAADEKKKIFEPEDAKQLLQGWLLHAHKGRNRHDLAARHYDRRKTLLGAMAAVFSAAVATSATLSAAFADIPVIKIVVAALGTLSAILVSLSAFLNLAERAEKHRSAGVRYKEIIWEIERVLSSRAGSLSGDDPAVTSIQKNMKELEAITPVVPEKIYDRVEREWNRNGIQIIHTADKLYR